MKRVQCRDCAARRWGDARRRRCVDGTYCGRCRRCRGLRCDRSATRPRRSTSARYGCTRCRPCSARGTPGDQRNRGTHGGLSFALGAPPDTTTVRRPERTNAAPGSSRKLVPNAAHIRSTHDTARTAACADVRENYVLLMIPVDPRVRRAVGDADGGGADAACGSRRDGASWLAWMSIRSGRHVPSSENLPGQPVALECPERPRGGVGLAAEFTGQFCFRRQPGPSGVFAAPDPPREHGVNVQVGPRVLPRIIHDQPHGQCKRLQPRRTACAPSGTPARGRTYG